MSARRKIARRTPPSLKRRSLLKTTTNALVGWIAVAIILSASIAAAGPLCSTSQVWLGAAIVGQSAAADKPADNKSQQTAELLRRARQAMAENDLTTADSLISRAEGLGVQYNWLYQGDTPKKARHDLDKKIAVAAASPTKPSQLLSPLGLSKDKKVADHRSVCRPVGRFARRCRECPTSHAVADGGSFQPDAPASPKTRRRCRRGSSLPEHAAGRQRRPLPAVTARGRSLRQLPPRRVRRPATVCFGRHAAPWPWATSATPPSCCNRRSRDESTTSRWTTPPRRSKPPFASIKTCLAWTRTPKPIAAPMPRNLMEQADGLLRWNELDEAERLASRAATHAGHLGRSSRSRKTCSNGLPPCAGRTAAGRCRRRPRPDYATRPAPPGPDARSAAESHGTGPPGPRGDCRRPIGSGRNAGPSGRTTAAARLGLCPGRRPSRAGVAGPRAIAAARCRRAWCPPADNTSLRPAATTNPTARPPAPCMIRPTIGRETCRRPTSSRSIRPTRGSPQDSTQNRARQLAPPRRRRRRRPDGGTRRGERRRAWRCSSRVKRP